tara:strand:- start:84 stop:260 length:177 start_codon:yes stop_codon:yes gene_type:complete
MILEEIKILAIIGLCLVIGVILGSGFIILILKDNNDCLKKRVDTLQQKLHNCVKANEH